MANVNDILGMLIDKVTVFSESAAVHGPFFFGVFLVVVSIIVMYRRDNRNMSIFYAVSGTIFMGLATFIFMQSESGERKYPYRIILTNLPKNADIHLPITAPPMYRDSISTTIVDYSVQLSTFGDINLESSSKFSVQHFTPIFDASEKPTVHKRNIGKHVVPFNGKPLSIYNLRLLNSQANSEEDVYSSEQHLLTAARLYLSVAFARPVLARNGGMYSTTFMRKEAVGWG